MRIKFAQDGYIEGYCTLGDMEGAAEFAGKIPDGFRPDTCQFYYRSGGELVLDEARQAAEQNREFAKQRIAELKNMLTESDYKIIKTTEYVLAGQEAPYDIQALNAERQTMRDEINRLEG